MSATEPVAPTTGQLKHNDLRECDPFIGPCPPWCWKAGSFHTMEVGQDDRKHVSDFTTIELPLMDAMVTRVDDMVLVDVSSVVVQMERRDRDVEPIISITVNEKLDVNLRLQDALHLRDVLTSLLQKAKSQR